MAQIIQFRKHKAPPPQAKPAKHKSSKPQNALSSADRSELDERIKSVTRRFKYPVLAKQRITHDIRESCGVSRYYHITPSQMTSYINELDSKEHRAYVFAQVRYVFNSWDNRNLEKVFIDCDMDMDRFIDRVVE
ncbi:MAG: hypothetical protein KZQ98_17810 [Candidatus Thiodiazotropha sp. (ex Lucinoma borealis)]|nr:hypothetical protein [Candidatus Thiodiazotropha sp. (ex Lucinoma borealis)]